MKPSKLTLTVAKEFGPDILNGKIFQDPTMISKLYNAFFNKKIEEINDFIEYIGKFLNDSQLFQLVEQLLYHEGEKIGREILRGQKTLGKYLFIYEIKKHDAAFKPFKDIYNNLISLTNDPEPLLKSISFPPIVYHHYKSVIWPLSMRLNPISETHFKYITENVLFNILKTILLEQLKTLDNPLAEAIFIKALDTILSLDNADKNYNGINSLIVRQNIFNAISQYQLTAKQVINSTDFTIMKLKSITDTLLILSETLSEAEFNQTVTNNLDSLLKISDPDILRFALKKLEPVTLLSMIAELNIFKPAAAKPISSPTNFNAPTVDMSTLNPHDSIENIRLRFKTLIESIKEIMEIPLDATPQQNNHFAIFQAFIAQLNGFTNAQWSALTPRTIAALTNQLNSNLKNILTDLPVNNNTTRLIECIAKCLENIKTFEISCVKQPAPEVNNPHDLIQSPTPNLVTKN